MELVSQQANEEAEKPLMVADVPKSDDGVVPHPYDYAELPLPLHKKALLVVTAPLLLLLAMVRIALLAVLCLLLVVVCLFFGRCRFIIQPVVSALGRLFLLAFGVWPGMLRLNKPAKPEPAPVLVLAPHCGALEGFVMMYDGMPRAIAMETYAKLPVVSSIFRASGGLAVPVPASNDEARKAKQQQHQRKHDAKVAPAELSEAPTATAAPPEEASRAQGPKPSTLAVRKAIAAHKQAFNPAVAANAVPLCILPEGTTHSGRTLVKFFSGAFEGGGPVQPVLLSYPYTHFHAAFFGAGMGEHVLRLLLNPWQQVEVTYLPVYHPSAEEQVDPDLYAENVRLAMCAAAGVPPSAYGAKALRKEYAARARGAAAGADKA